MNEFSHLDTQLDILDQYKDSWVKLPLVSKIEMLKRLIDRTVDVAHSQIEAAAKAKGIPLDSHLVGEEWLGGPLVTVRNLRLLVESLEQIEQHGLPQLKPNAVTTRADGQVVVDVFPNNAWDKLMYQGFSAEVWMDPEVTPESLRSHMASLYQAPPSQGHIALVLGAGNVASIGPLDVIYKLYAEGQVCILKMNPVNDYLGPFIEEAFREYIDAGFLQIAYGAGDVGAYLCQHEKVDEIHITGSDVTHDLIVFGSGPEGKERKKRNEPINTKRITSELGNVSPIIVVPGEWSASDIQFQAENLATQLANNAGFNCNAARVIITPQNWDQRDALLNALRETLKNITPRVAYYPGAKERHDAFVAAHPNAELIGKDIEEHLPWVFIPHVDYQDTNNICFTTEAFCGLACETTIPASNTADYLKKAVDFCNNTVWGTLSASLIVNPKTARELASHLDQAIANLRYGSVVINHWPALSYGLGVTTWGAFPGHTYDDIQSGIGVVHNTFLFDKPQKSVVRGPFRVKPTPPWFVTNKNTHNIAPKLLKFEQKPGILKLGNVFVSALQG